METLDKQVLEIGRILGKLMDARKDKALFSHEMLVTYPVFNLAIHNTRAIQSLVNNKNYIASNSILRSLYESMFVYVYSCTAKKHEGWETKMAEHKRLYRYVEVNKKWAKVTDADLIKQFGRVLGAHVNRKQLITSYNYLCDMLHFSTEQLNQISSSNPDKTNEYMLSIRLSAKDNNIPKEKWDQLILGAQRCLEVMLHFLKLDLENKNKSDLVTI